MFVYPTVFDALALPIVRDGEPRVLAGQAGLDRRVRWVHTAEVADIAHLLRGGELLLTTGIALPSDAPGLTQYVDELAGVGAAGLVVELIRRWRNDTVPEALKAAADRHSLPLITLTKETPFVEVTEAVIRLIVDTQVAELTAAEQVHDAFTRLTFAGAQPAEVLREVARLGGGPVVLENLAHDVLAYDAAGASPGELLADWKQRSAAVTPTERTSFDERSGWLVTVVGARGADWGRLVLVCNGVPIHRQIVAAQRAGSALALHYLVGRDRDSLERQTHRQMLAELLNDGYPSADFETRVRALGVDLENRHLVGVAVRPRTITPASPAPAMATQEVLLDLAEATATAVRRLKLPALVANVDETTVRALLAMPIELAVERTLLQLAREIHHAAGATPSSLSVVVAVGTTVRKPSEAKRSLAEAAHVASAALQSSRTRVYHRLDDVRLSGLLHLLRDDDRLTAFAERELAPLVEHDAKCGTRLLDLLRHLCEHGGNKSAAANAAHLSRTAYYQQLARIAQILGVSLDEPASVQSLHVALMAHDLQNPGTDAS